MLVDDDATTCQLLVVVHGLHDAIRILTAVTSTPMLCPHETHCVFLLIVVGGDTCWKREVDPGGERGIQVQMEELANSATVAGYIVLAKELHT